MSYKTKEIANFFIKKSLRAAKAKTAKGEEATPEDFLDSNTLSKLIFIAYGLYESIFPNRPPLIDERPICMNIGGMNRLFFPTLESELSQFSCEPVKTLVSATGDTEKESFQKLTQLTTEFLSGVWDFYLSAPDFKYYSTKHVLPFTNQTGEIDDKKIKSYFTDVVSRAFENATENEAPELFRVKKRRREKVAEGENEAVGEVSGAAA